MRIIETRVYAFDELTDKAKAKAVDRLCDLNVDYDWWDSTYEDAANVGAKITSFDLGRGEEIDFEFVDPAVDVAKALMEQRGEACDTYSLASAFLKGMDWQGDRDEDYEEIITEAFQLSLGKAYLDMLRGDYEYRTSDEAIIETIQANEYEYEFTEAGKLYEIYT